MVREMEWNAEVTKIHHTNYVRNSRAIAVAWFVFSACYTILNIVAFIQPFWFGDTNESPGVGYFGLYEWCERTQGSEYSCLGNFLDFNTVQNEWFQASSFLVGGAALLFIFSIICMIFFMFLKARIVLRICGCLQLVAAMFMMIACIIYPVAFDDDNVRRICGQESKAYVMDKCQIRWAYILAIVLIFDAFILATLAFVLAARQAKMIPEFKKLKEEDHMTYIRQWRDTSHSNHGFPSNNSNRFRTPSQQRSYLQPQPVHKRENYTNLDISTQHFTPLETDNDAHFQPTVIRVDDFENSPRSSSRSDPNEGNNSVRSRRSQGSPSNGGQRSPRSENASSPRDDVFEGFDRVASIRSKSDSSFTSEDLKNLGQHVALDNAEIHL